VAYAGSIYAETDQGIAGAGLAPAAPIPPRELIERTGVARPDESDELVRALYERSGRALKIRILKVLPDGYSFEGRRVLDFGCGAGRVLRQFLPEATSGEFWGCDLHRPAIDWLDQNLSPPFRFFVNDGIPMPHSDEHFDLVYAISVFTHITHDWSAWLLELHRILKPDGLLMVTLLGPKSWGVSLRNPPHEDAIGMCVQRLGKRLDDTSGPRVLHSPWWLHAHWGRAFEMLPMKSFVYAGNQGFVIGRKRDVSLTRDDLERPDPKDPRELEAQRYQLAVLEEEAEEVRREYESTLSWRVTRPLRAAGRMGRWFRSRRSR
jgi:SAM-dependent methyltransferase